MGLLSSIFGGGGCESPGTEVSRIVFDFLRSSSGYRLTASTFTELFAFAHVELDSALCVRGASGRGRVTDSMRPAFLETLQTTFSDDDAEAREETLHERVDEYGQMRSSGKSANEMIEVLDLMLKTGSAPLNFDLMSMFQSKFELRGFYTGVLHPLIIKVAARYQ